MGQQFAPVLVGPELLALALSVVGDDGVGRVQDVGGASVVLLKADDPAALVLAFKAQDIFNGGAAEFIDALVIVAHHADIAPAPRQKRGQAVLQAVRVLVLVDEHIAEAALPVLQHVGVFLQELDGVVNEIVKVHGVGGKAAAGVLLIDLAVFSSPEIRGHGGCLQICCRGQALVLGPAHLGEDAARRVHFLVQIHVLCDVL